MIESGVVMRDLTLENPIRAIREISHDITGRRTVRLANGRELSALEIQTEYLEPGPRLRRPRGLPTTRSSRRGSSTCGSRGLKAVESGDLSLVEREIDWVIKCGSSSATAAKHDLPLSSPRVAQLDLAYHDITATAGCTTCCSGGGPRRTA
jgi:proteasome accessory factor A